MNWWQTKRRDEDLERELRSDLELEEEEQRSSGLSPEESRYAARRAFGNTTLIKEQTRETWGWGPLERFLQDLRYTWRVLLEKVLYLPQLQLSRWRWELEQRRRSSAP